MERVMKIADKLPKESELVCLIPDENEVNYILKMATTFISKLHKDYENSKNIEPVTLSEEETFFLVQSLTDKMWERINTGHYSEVPIEIRKVFAVANFFKIIFLLLNSTDFATVDKCSEILDKAILVGSIENLYSDCKEFINESSSFFDKILDCSTSAKLPLIQAQEHREFECDIPILDCPSIEVFKENHFAKRYPVLLRGVIKHWPALTKWKDPNYLIKIAGNRTVPIEIGSNYATENWSQELIKIKDFMRRQFGSENEKSPIVEYLAQHELFDQIPKLKDDIRIMDYCCLSDSGADNTVDIKAWLGPCGTISQMHQDPKHNILCQVFGNKKIILASSDDSEFLYPYDGILNNTSEINAEDVDFDKFPLAKNVKFYNLVLQEGECLYIPPKWWHFVKSLSKSFSVSFWWE